MHYSLDSNGIISALIDQKTTAAADISPHYKVWERFLSFFPILNFIFILYFLFSSELIISVFRGFCAKLLANAQAAAAANQVFSQLSLSISLINFL